VISKNIYTKAQTLGHLRNVISTVYHLLITCKMAIDNMLATSMIIGELRLL